MLHEPGLDESSEAARPHIREAIMMAFCTALQETRLPPMAVMALVAEAVGSIYREVADVHRPIDACPCGWRPDQMADVEALQTALAMMAEPAPVTDLRRIQPAGRA